MRRVSHSMSAGRSASPERTTMSGTWYLIMPFHWQTAVDRERFEAVARSLRDLLTQRWLLTEKPTSAPKQSAFTICPWNS